MKIVIRNRVIPEGGGGEINFRKSNSPAAARIHVSQEDENVVEHFQMHEHPDR